MSQRQRFQALHRTIGNTLSCASRTETAPPVYHARHSLGLWRTTLATRTRKAWLCVRLALQGLPYALRELRNPDPQLAPWLLRRLGANIGKNVTFKGPLLIDNAFEDEDSAGDFSHLNIGDNCYIGMGVYFDLANRVTLGNDVVVSGRVSFLTHADCNRSNWLAERFPRKCEPVTVKNGAWIGFGATLTAGVTVGGQTVVAAGSVLLADARDRYLYAGLSARPVRYLGHRPKP